MDGERLVRVRGDLRGGQPRGGRADAAAAQHAHELDLLGGGVVGELVPLLVHLGLDQLVLRGDGHELARGHRERARREPREPGEQDRVLRPAAAADARDQRDVGDKPVHRPEDGGPQPAAGHVPVLVAVVLGRGPCRVLSPGHSREGARASSRARGVGMMCL